MTHSKKATYKGFELVDFGKGFRAYYADDYGVSQNLLDANDAPQTLAAAKRAVNDALANDLFKQWRV